VIVVPDVEIGSFGGVGRDSLTPDDPEPTQAIEMALTYKGSGQSSVQARREATDHAAAQSAGTSSGIDRMGVADRRSDPGNDFVDLRG
jgi:hypothetical protein